MHLYYSVLKSCFVLQKIELCVLLFFCVLVFSFWYWRTGRWNGNHIRENTPTRRIMMTGCDSDRGVRDRCTDHRGNLLNDLANDNILLFRGDSFFVFDFFWFAAFVFLFRLRFSYLRCLLFDFLGRKVFIATTRLHEGIENIRGFFSLLHHHLLHRAAPDWARRRRILFGNSVRILHFILKSIYWWRPRFSYNGAWRSLRRCGLHTYFSVFFRPHAMVEVECRANPDEKERKQH